ncbi:hypothetical protein Drorol1_Dr00021116 [Drosera rotundifolia]
MPESTTPPPPPNNPTAAKQSMLLLALKVYWIPLTLFALSMFFQLFVLPSSFPPSHYDVLGIRMDSSIEQVKEAYEKLLSKWNSGTDLPATADFIKSRYAFELLSNPLWKRDYDLFGVDEHIDVLEKIKQQYAGKTFTSVKLPLLGDVGSCGSQDDDLNFISPEKFQMLLRESKPLLIQIYSHGSCRCREYSNTWKRIAEFLGEIANTAVVELGELQLAGSLAEKKMTGQPFFRNGLPSLIAFPEGCTTSKCIVRYEGDHSVDGVTDWFATTVLGLPRILYYSKDTLGPKFLAKSSHTKVKVIFFSSTGVRATPFVRQIAKAYQAYASFAFVLWREEDYSVWWQVYDVESAPATVIIKDPGIKPLVYYGEVNSSWFSKVMEENKLHVLPQLRSLTSMKLGCDARGYSRAGADTMIWYCVIVVGRPSPELNKMRETLRRIQDVLSNDSELEEADIGAVAAPSVSALKEKRLTFAWMDGEAQKNLCVFYIGTDFGVESCGPRRRMEDSPNLVIIRYMRNNTIDDVPVPKKKPNLLLGTDPDDVDPVAQLVARYNGTEDVPQIIEWVSKIIKDGDSANLPFYRTKTPELVPETADSVYAPSTILSSRKGVQRGLKSFVSGFRDSLGDPRIGPMLLLLALMSFGGIWLHRKQSAQSGHSNSATGPRSKREIPEEWKKRGRIAPTGDLPPSLTDMNLNNADQKPLRHSEPTSDSSDSD